MDTGMSDDNRTYVQVIMERYLENPEDIARATAARNVASVARVPSSHMSDAERSMYLIRATSEDVYCYCGTRVWNLWLLDVRIPIPPLTHRRYQVARIGFEGVHTAHVTITDTRDGKEYPVTYYLNHARTEEHARRRIDAFVSSCNLDEENPATHGGIHIE
jgi:hypothetical protein